MGRPERALDPASGPREAFAAALRCLRAQAGRPTYREMAALTRYSAPALSRAAAGDRFPTLEATLAFVQACGGVETEWQERWRQAHAELMPEATAVTPAAAPAPGASDVGTPQDVGAVKTSAARHWLRRAGSALAHHRMAAVLAVAAANALLNMVLVLDLAGGAPKSLAVSAFPSGAGLDPLDGTDPYINRCGGDQIRLEQRTWPIYWLDGRLYGQLALYHSKNCQASWGYVYGHNSPAWTVVITDRRLGQDPQTTVVSLRGAAAPDSWGNVLSDRTGCVHAEAYVVTAAGLTGPTTMTSCWQESGPVFRQPGQVPSTAGQYPKEHG